ncbi:L,D-transpeptidase family protein [Pontibacter sp. G13]|uniref:L,D-transpeptidase family protein n=1 Tax=Pontibacter sp. G13 TaxID=3074898 RepID=UPI00288B8542|nr:L,D-transpeptidase family protein [Pontibacter sp. G13]WNJ18867.1 L,D-transpeptidase family protein [Pontibacter sp. G13]
MERFLSLPFYLCAIGLIFSCQTVSSDQQNSERVKEAGPSPDQLIVVSVEEWSDFQGVLQAFERNDQGRWEEAFDAFPIVIGKNGLALGIHQLKGNQALKREGDLKTPAGMFSIGSAFGYAPKPLPGINLSYHPVTAQTMCIEDTASQFYNQILEEDEVQADWSSTDRMLRKDNLYEWGFFLNHNSPDAVPQAGSCIFFHIWRGADRGTAGCTAMSPENMIKLLEWIDPQKHPVVIQAPRSEALFFPSIPTVDSLANSSLDLIRMGGFFQDSNRPVNQSGR